MTSFVSFDLRVARKKAGLTQQDCAHLLGVHPSAISLIETGKREPKLLELCLFSVIYRKPIDALASDAFREARFMLRERVATLPEAPERWPGRFNRHNTLSALEHYLLALTNEDYGGEA